MGPGPNRMNRLVVRQTTAGVIRWLGLGSQPKIVVGFDARHRSEEFALDVVDVAGALGAAVELVDKPMPTPVLAHWVLGSGADAGIMITASHNPAADNGYKLYLADGIQLVSPSDAEIAAEIDQVVADGGVPAPGAGLDRVKHIAGQAANAHLEAAQRALCTPHRDVQVLYTAMHGVGGKHLMTAFAQAGFPTPTVVDAQFDPDPEFRTVPFPNPEEAGALDMALAQAQHEGVDVVLANDPDADRLAVAIPNPTGEWVSLSGDQVGILLADHLLSHTEGTNRLVASSIVSSTMIDAVAHDAGAKSVRSLTGFKWVARPIVDHPDQQYVLGYEEALGYCVGSLVRDKDGISAALVVAEMVAESKAKNETLWDRLDRLYERHGVYLTKPVTLVFTGPDPGGERERIMSRLISAPPQQLDGVDVDTHEDLALGLHYPPTTGVLWGLVDGSRVVVRPSGTEPKLKAYLEVVVPLDAEVTSAVAEAKQQARQRLADLAEAVSAVVGQP